jgi:hypothetical protein
MAIEVRTLKQFLDSDQVIDCDCSNYWVCTHTGPFKLEMAIQRLGWEFDFYAGREILALRTYCSVCGKRQPTFRLGWKDKPATYAGSHGAGLEMKPVAEMRKPAIKWIEGGDWVRGGKNVRKFGPGR